MRRTILALAAACESLGLRTMDAGLRIVDAAAWVRDHVDPKRHGDAAVQERERMDADREAFDRFMASLEVADIPAPRVAIIPPPIDTARLDGELRFEPVVTPNLGGPWPRRKRSPFSIS